MLETIFLSWYFFGGAVAILISLLVAGISTNKHPFDNIVGPTIIAAIVWPVVLGMVIFGGVVSAPFYGVFLIGRFIRYLINYYKEEKIK